MNGSFLHYPGLPVAPGGLAAAFPGDDQGWHKGLFLNLSYALEAPFGVSSLGFHRGQRRFQDGFGTHLR